MQEFEFVDNRRVFSWFVGILVFAVGVLAAVLIMPGVRRTPGMGQSEIHLPKKAPVSPQDSPKMPLPVSGSHEAPP